MANSTSLFDWQILLLLCPVLLGISLFAYLLWSDRKYERKMKNKEQEN